MREPIGRRCGLGHPPTAKARCGREAGGGTSPAAADGSVESAGRNIHGETKTNPIRIRSGKLWAYVL